MSQRTDFVKSVTNKKQPVEYILSKYGIIELSITCVAFVSFVVFLCYYLGAFLSVANHRHSKKVGGLRNVEPQPVSVIVVVKDDFDYIENTLPVILNQSYDAPYQVVVVCDTPESYRTPEMLKELSAKYKHLYVTIIPADSKFEHTNKLALTVGMKAAKYDNIIITSSECTPVSGDWLGVMSYGFTSDHVIISGYNRVSREKGFFNSFQRAVNIHESFMMLSRAVAGHPYRVSRHNNGQSKKLFFNNKGFTEYLRLNVGESDLYIQQIARYAESNVIINPKGVTESKSATTFTEWYNKRKFYSYPFRYFSAGCRMFISSSYLFTALFWLSVIALISLMVPFIWIGAAAMILIRWFVIAAVTKKLCRRTGDNPPYLSALLYDFISPAEITILTVSRNILSLKNLWV